MKKQLTLKICGLSNPQTIDDVTQLAPDMMGFIFYEKSPRYIGLQTNAEKHMEGIPNTVDTIGVFVNASLASIQQAVERYQLTGIQLHGDETPEFARSVKALDLIVIKAFRLSDNLPNDLMAYQNIADYFLFDTETKNYGGSGRQFDWNLLNDYTLATPFFLSGGIDLDDIPTILQLNHPQLIGIDVNSRFEIEPGKKDLHKLSQVKSQITNYQVNDKGYYGKFGGAFIPEMLHPNVEELRQHYLEIIETDSFKKDFEQLLHDYVGRPTPLYFAERLSETYQTKVYLKREDLAHTGAHKINNTIGQILLAKRLGKEKIIAETGAGQHGVATATVCALMGMDCIVYMGEVDMARQRPNVERMKLLGAQVKAATSGSKTLKDATNEAMRHWIAHPTDTHYIIGSVVGPHPYPDMVARFQSVISAEIKRQLLIKEGTENPHYVIACVGGGSNAAGAFYHYLDNPSVNLIAAEAAGLGIHSGESAATTALGHLGILHGSKTLLMQSEDGQIIEPYSISAGLDYPGIGPMHAHLFDAGRAKFFSITDEKAMTAGVFLSKQEGIIPAIESAHALAVLEKQQFKRDDIVVINLSGRGDKDLETYISWGKY